MSLIWALAYMVAQCLGAICGVGLVKAFMKSFYNSLGGGANSIVVDYSKGIALGAEIIGTFVLVYTFLSAADPKRSTKDSHVPPSNTTRLQSRLHPGSHSCRAMHDYPLVHHLEAKCHSLTSSSFDVKI
ncbi:hypothetical protein PVL29_013267 [Vitis rotundifolia]|uniref:Uncharacterized protein n=1 Tax=Vitis rotundifolia TaxID=103349 RepID=A0AA39DPJ1_VITRO|nr:hypothetical protein PVL29_013267 [Vitis rotundifolia]